MPPGYPSSTVALPKLGAALPRLPVGEQHPISGALQSTMGSLVAWAVPPPPAAPHSETLSGGRAGLWSGVGSNVVPPPPSVQNVGSSSADGQLGSLASSGKSLSSAGVQVVPPPPSLQGSGNDGAGRRTSSLSNGGVGNALQVVPPAPSVGAAGGRGNADHGARQ